MLVRPRYRCRGAVLLQFTTLVLVAASAGEASLGEAYESVQRDRAHLSARMESNSVGTHVVHALTTPNGGSVREFARSDGTVFAVTWRGPARPDLRQLLGSSFDRVQTVSAARGPRHMRMPVAVHDPDLVVRSAGHPGAFFGAAYLPQLAPADFTLDELQQ
ncbi:MAG: DUF2844 domain-containing protein [Alphaproteobacteria bacterium]|nr:DUF2844 domain-containing protein [Alphaproteobacteria bacterium]